MRTVTIRRKLKAPVEYVFDSITDTTRLARLKRVHRVEELARGHREPYGAGMRRRLHLGMGVWLQEEVIEFDRPRWWTYRIAAARPGGFRHERGHILFEPAPSGTQVTWVTSFVVPLPLVGAIAERVVGGLVALAFHYVLTLIDRQHATDKAAQHQYA